MNIAITMSGVSRYPKKSYLNLKNQIITPLQDKGCNVKVFIHTWDTKTVVDQKWGYNDSSEKRNYENDFKLSKEWYKKNKIENLVVNQIELGEPDESGRRKPEIKEGSEFMVKADMVIKALGFDPENLPLLFDAQELQVTKWGTIKTDFNTMETNLKGVFAAGDIVRGASLVVWAIRDGRDAAVQIEKYLQLKVNKKAVEAA